MALPFYATEAGTGQIITLDDESVVKDQAALNGTGGNAYEAFLLSTIFDQGQDGGYSDLRRATQHVHAEGGVTVDITPYRDEQESGSTIQRVLTTGDNPIVIAPLFETGTNFQIKAAVNTFDAAVELGKAQQYVVPRRQSR